MNGATTATLSRSWRNALLAIFLVVGWATYLYWTTASSIVTIWVRSETFTHGFMVPPIVIWLVWRKRRNLGNLIPQPDSWSILLLALVALAWLVGDFAAVNALTQLAFVAMLVLTVPAILGRRVAKAIAFPLFFLFFAVPFGEFAMPQFMVWTADFTVLALRISGIPVYREGLQFVIPSGNWSVVEACSGIRYLIASVTVGTLFAYLNYQSIKRRVIFVCISILVPVLANWVRAYIIVMLGHLSGNKLAAGVDHLIYGWLFFGIVIMLMFMIGGRWAEPEVSAPAGHEAEPGTSKPPHWFQRSLVTAVLASLVIGLPPVARMEIFKHDRTAPVQLGPVNHWEGGWELAAEPLVDWNPAFANPSAQVNMSLRQGARKVGLYIGYYRQQNYGHKLVSSENALVKTNDPSWAKVAGGTRALSMNAQKLTLRSAELRGASKQKSDDEMRLNAWQIYWINGTWTSSDALAKLYGAWHRLAGRGDDSAVVVVYTLKGVDGAGDAALEAFLVDNFQAINALLQQTSSQ